jgi:hypothetical protein
MLPFEDRFTRQRQLREVGLSGQERLQASSIALGVSRAELVAADYLRRAGVQVREVEAPSAECEEAPLAADVPCAFEGPAAYLRGSLLALDHIRQVLGVATQGGSSTTGSGVNQYKATES